MSSSRVINLLPLSLPPSLPRSMLTSPASSSYHCIQGPASNVQLACHHLLPPFLPPSLPPSLPPPSLPPSLPPSFSSPQGARMISILLNGHLAAGPLDIVSEGRHVALTSHRLMGGCGCEAPVWLSVVQRPQPLKGRPDVGPAMVDGDAIKG